MFGTMAYIAWARQFYGKVPFDLASSGVPVVPWHEVQPDPIDVDAPGAELALRDAIARYNDVPPGDVVPALGTSHAIFLAYAALAAPGDELLVEHPTYEPLVRTASGLGLTVRTFARDPERGYALEPARIAALVGPKTRAVVVTTLQNPTGVRTEPETLRDLAARLAPQGVTLLVDEVYAPLEELPTEDGVFANSARKLGPNVVAIGSLTKCYGLGMQRVGWVLGPAAVVARAEQAVIATLGHTPQPWAAHGTAAFAAVPRLATRTRDLVAGRRAVVDAWLATVPGARWSAPPAEGLFGLVTLPGRGDLRVAIESLAHERGVLVGAGAFFGVPEAFRLSWATCDAAKLAEALLHLATLAS